MKTIKVHDSLELLTIYKEAVLDKKPEYQNLTIDLSNYSEDDELDVKLLEKFKKLSCKNILIKFKGLKGKSVDHRNGHEAMHAAIASAKTSIIGG